MGKKEIASIKAARADLIAEDKDERKREEAAFVRYIRCKYDPIVLPALVDAIATHRTEPILIRVDDYDIGNTMRMLYGMGIRCGDSNSRGILTIVPQPLDPPQPRHFDAAFHRAIRRFGKKDIATIKARYEEWIAQVKADQKREASARTRAIRVKYAPVVLPALADAIATRRTEPILICVDGPDLDVVAEMVDALGFDYEKNSSDPHLIIRP